jgi:DNA polymerase-3 subunit delta'
VTATRTIWPAASAGPVGLLRRDLASGRTSHAYLFTGAAGRLPLEAALAFAAALVCTADPPGCGDCEACRRVMHHAHPDVTLIEPAGTQMLVEQVRDVVKTAWRTPDSEHRVIIVDGADRMNPNAQNAFLKALEEPPPSTTIVLLAPSPDALLETVRSRCREVVFASPAPAEVASILEESGVGENEAASYARTGGSLERAASLASDPDARALRAELVERVITGLRDPGEAIDAAEWLGARTRQLRDTVASAHAAEQEALKQWLSETKRASDDRLRREQRRAEQDALDAAVDDVISVLRDVLAATADPSARLVNDEQRDRIVHLAASATSPARVLSSVADIERSRRRLRANANVQLTLEEIFLALYRAFSTEGVA